MFTTIYVEAYQRIANQNRRRTCMNYYAVAIISSLIWCFIWAYAAETIIYNKGYVHERTKWALLGFFFSFIAVIIAATKPDFKGYYSTQATENRPPQADEWRCSCGRINKNYVWSCACGKNKSDLEKAPQQLSGKTENTSSKKDSMTMIREYKALLNEGIITQEEFDAKKKQLLGL